MARKKTLKSTNTREFKFENICLKLEANWGDNAVRYSPHGDRESSNGIFKNFGRKKRM
jgi:hypothetical protein